MYKHIFWDFDGTMFDTYPIMSRAFQTALREDYGIKEDADEISKYMKVSRVNAFEHYRKKYGISDSFIERYELLSRGQSYLLAKPFPNVQGICSAIHDSGGYNYLYTHRGNSALALLQKYGMYGRFTDFITSENGFEPKPSPQALIHMLDKYSIPRDEAIMVGDREIDMLAAKSAGISACIFPEKQGTESKADYTIMGFNELYNIIGLAQR